MYGVGNDRFLIEFMIELSQYVERHFGFVIRCSLTERHRVVLDGVRRGVGGMVYTSSRGVCWWRLFIRGRWNKEYEYPFREDLVLIRLVLNSRWNIS